MNYNTDNKTDTIYQPTIYQYANIIIDISHESVDKTFQYRIPDYLLGQVEAGQQVYILLAQAAINAKAMWWS